MKNLDDKYNLSWYGLVKAIIYFLGPKKYIYALWTILLILIYSFDLVPPFILGQIIDFFTKYSAGQSLNPFYFYVLFLGISISGVATIRLILKRRIATIRNSILYEIKTQGFQNLLNYSLKWHDEENTGNKIQRINTGAAAMRSLISLVNSELYRFIASYIGLLGIFLFLDIKFFIIAIAYLFCFLGIQKIFYKRMKDLINEGNKAQEHASGKYYEGITNILSIKSLGAGNSIKSKIKTAEGQSKELADRLTFIGTFKWQIFQIINAIAVVLFLLALGDSYLQSIISVGSILVYWSYFSTLQNNTGDTTKYIDELIEYKQSIARMMPIFSSLESNINGEKYFPENWQNIEIRKGFFQYSKDSEYILNNINISIKRNQKIGIAGQTGSGKSTFVKMLLGLYKFNKGKFLVDTTDFYDISNTDVTKNISIVLQESELFNFSLLENITLFKDVSEDLLRKAIEISHLESVINKLPEGLDTMIGEKGYRVSGGERQRIAIARAICIDTQILLLDEATSNLDVNTEKAIQTAIETRLIDKTIITIAHRSATLTNSDVIYIFKKGEIVEQGTFQELIGNTQSEFAKINSHNQIE